MADVDLAALIAQRAALDAAIGGAHDDALNELVAAKDAYRTDPSETNRARKAAAVAAVQLVRAHLREGRTAPQVGGDAFLSPTQNEG
jgi:membrane protein involved in colicin uptake